MLRCVRRTVCLSVSFFTLLHDCISRFFIWRFQFCENGSLDNVLKDNPSLYLSAKLVMAHGMAVHDFLTLAHGISSTSLLLRHTSTDIASGMAELERVGLVHRDVAVSCLLDLDFAIYI